MLPMFRGFAAVALLTCVVFLGTVKGEEAASDRISLGAVDSWGYQLQNVSPSVVAQDGFDLLVVDYSADGTGAGALSREAVAALRPRPGQPQRIILAYLSIGEAEDYRYYWQTAWSEKGGATSGEPASQVGVAANPPATAPTPAEGLARLTASAPSWLAGENRDWRGNYLVRYWEPAWQDIMFGSAGAYLDKILAAGFDGVYLDKIDSNDDWQPSRPQAEREMVEFVKKLAAYARERRPGFLIVPQNGEELVGHADYLATIDAIAKEDLLFGRGKRRDGEPNTLGEIRESRRHLDAARRSGRPVMVVEYLDQPQLIESARRRLLGYRYIPFFAKRALDEAPRPPSSPEQRRP